MVRLIEIESQFNCVYRHLQGFERYFFEIYEMATTGCIPLPPI